MIIIFSILFIYYLRYIYFFYVGLNRKYENLRKDTPFVSVVVAAKNEEKTLPTLLSLLINQEYDKEKYEIIIANDRSTDQTADIVLRFQDFFDNLQLVNVKPPPKKASRKKNALTQAVNHSKGEIILLTDADCQVPSTWIKDMVKYFDKNVGMVAGLSLPQRVFRPNLVQKFEYFDMLVLFTAEAGAIGSDRPFACSGQNLAYTREAYDEVNGYESVKQYESGDDVLLMQLIRKAGYKIRFAFDENTYATTATERNLIHFLNQRIRWASNEKPQSFLNKEFLIYLVDVFLLNLTLVITLFLDPLLFLSFFLVKLVFEFIILNRGRKTFALRFSEMWFLPFWSILHPFYVIITGIGERLNLFRWKK